MTAPFPPSVDPSHVTPRKAGPLSGIGLILPGTQGIEKNIFSPFWFVMGIPKKGLLDDALTNRGAFPPGSGKRKAARI